MYQEAYVFKCEQGFGCFPFTSGSAITGVFLCDNEKARIDSSHILRLASEEEIKNKRVGE